MKDIYCLDIHNEHVRVMAAGMEVFHSAKVNYCQCTLLHGLSLKCDNLLSTVYITDANIGFLVSSILLWVLSVTVVLTIIGSVTMAVRRGKVCIHSLMFQN